jgi:drug/metabolite transporter (DMT)-like permease
MSQSPLSSKSSSLFLTLTPAIFVLLWSTGWIVARYAAPHADPLTFLSVRYAVAFMVIAVFALAIRAPWPSGKWAIIHTLISGVLIHAIYLGAVWWAIKKGVPAGISGLIAALQPLLTAALGGWLIKEHVKPLQWLGVAVGFIGVLLVLEPKLVQSFSNNSNQTSLLIPIIVNCIGMLSATLGSFYQKRYLATGDLRTITAMQYIGALSVTLPIALVFEDLRFDLVPETFYALAWAVIPLSIGAISLMLIMIRKGAVSRVASLIYLVPPTVAIQAWLMFDEKLVTIQIIGMVITAFGVYLSTKRT